MTLDQAVKAFRDAFATRAFAKRDNIGAPFYALTAASKQATFAERDAAIVALLEARGIDADNAEITGLMAVASGALVEDGASTRVGLDTLLDRMAEGADVLAAAAARDEYDLDASSPPAETFALYERRWIAGWKNHVRGVMARLARDVEARKRVRGHARFVTAVRALADVTWAHHLRYVVEVLDMLDDEPLHVIDLAGGSTLRRYRAYGVRNGFHLMTLLEGHDPVELREREVEYVEAQDGWFTWPALDRADDGTFTAKHLGSLLWGEPRSVDLPCFEGVRTIIRAQRAFARSWDTSFVVPIHDALREQLVLERELAADEARPILERIVAAVRAGRADRSLHRWVSNETVKETTMQIDLKNNSELPVREEEKGAIGWAFLVWLFGGGLGLAVLVFILLKLF